MHWVSATTDEGSSEPVALALALASWVFLKGCKWTAFRQQGFKHSFYVHNLDVGWDPKVPGTWLQRNTKVVHSVSYGPSGLADAASLLAMHRNQCVLSRMCRQSMARCCHSVKNDFLVEWKLMNSMPVLLWVWRLKWFYKTLKMIRETRFKLGRSRFPMSPL